MRDVRQPIEKLSIAARRNVVNTFAIIEWQNGKISHEWIQEIVDNETIKISKAFTPLLAVKDIVYMKLDLLEVLFKPRLWFKRTLIDRRRHPISYHESAKDAKKLEKEMTEKLSKYGVF